MDEIKLNSCFNKKFGALSCFSKAVGVREDMNDFIITRGFSEDISCIIVRGYKSFWASLLYKTMKLESVFADMINIFSSIKKQIKQVENFKIVKEIKLWCKNFPRGE